MKDAFEQRLAALQPPAERGGQTRAIRERYDAIEAALARGVTRQQIVDLLAEDGITVSLAFFKNALYRIRQERSRPAKVSTGISTPPSKQGTSKTIKPSSSTKAPITTPEEAPKTDAWTRLDEIRQSTPDLQALRKQHLDSLKKGQT